MTKRITGEQQSVHPPASDRERTARWVAIVRYHRDTAAALRQAAEAAVFKLSEDEPAEARRLLAAALRNVKRQATEPKPARRKR